MNTIELLTAEGRTPKVYLIMRGGNRTTEEVIGATAHTSVDVHIGSQSFSLCPGPEERQVLIAFQIPDLTRDPKIDMLIGELARFNLSRPTYEDALKFDEAYPDEEGFFLFPHEPWHDPVGYERVLYVHRRGLSRELNLAWTIRSLNRHSLIVGIPFV